jgi:hypothetical protein
MLDRPVKAVYRCHPAFLDKETETALITNSIKFVGKQPDYPLPTKVGIEVEVERAQHAAIQAVMWRATRDGSLRNDGIELLTHPLTSRTYPYAIAELESIFKKIPQLEFSHRCSIHVHMDVSERLVGEVFAMIAAYLCTENLFFNQVAPYRKGNSFCYPLSDALFTQDFLLNELDNHFKYAALNPHHLRDFGTLEFRHHGGTKDMEELKQWIELILSLYRYGTRVNYNRVKEAILALNTDSTYSEFVKDIFGEHAYLFRFLNLKQEMENGVTTAKVFLEG